MKVKTAQELIQDRLGVLPHVLLLGAGASKASFLRGDARGRLVPIMNELVELPDLQRLFEEAGLRIESTANFEELYSELTCNRENAPLARKVEKCVQDYFTELQLPDTATLYDHLLISMRPIDTVFTFNWDPFLFDAYQRNSGRVPLPEIFFLHGNVRISACPDHDMWGARNLHCPICRRAFADVPLLYPIRQKDYSRSPYIRRSWDEAKARFKEVFTLTIFGYGAPESDRGTCDLLKLAWLNGGSREFEHIEIIDTGSPAILVDRWFPFTPTHHYHLVPSFKESRIARWPRRSAEAMFYAMSNAIPCEGFPLPGTDRLREIQEHAAAIAQYE